MCAMICGFASGVDILVLVLCMVKGVLFSRQFTAKAGRHYALPKHMTRRTPSLLCRLTKRCLYKTTEQVSMQIAWQNVCCAHNSFVLCLGDKNNGFRYYGLIEWNIFCIFLQAPLSLDFGSFSKHEDSLLLLSSTRCLVWLRLAAFKLI